MSNENNASPSSASPNGKIDPTELAKLKARYEEERQKRLRDDGYAQFIHVAKSDPYKHFADDPFVDTTTIRPMQEKFPDNRCEILIIGAGWAGIQNAVRMVQAGIPAEDIRIIDSAGGFGGTWYWNRYPGLMCDIESYSYLPYLEETGYVPKHRYAQGEEIREYANLVTRKWNIAECGVFQTQAQKIVWDEAAKEWQVNLVQCRKGGPAEKNLQIRARFVVIGAGILNLPKLPNVPGILKYQGEIFHSSRWAYDITGGSPQDPSLSMSKLKDKRVAIIGTGATGVQLVPQLARSAKHLYVVQRTPANVDDRDQRETDKEWFQKVTQSPNWQRERMRNFHQFFTLGKTPEINLVDDGWTRAPGLLGWTGNADGPKRPEEIPAYLEQMYQVDTPRQARIHARVDKHVKDPVTAAKLKPWYPLWCKRPAFHDDYLEAFNRENVTLIDVSSKKSAIDQITEDSLVIGDEMHQVDVIIFATGFLAPPAGTPAEKANIFVIGLDGVSMTEEWPRVGPTTLHGVIDAKFPNLFLSGPQQASTSGNYRFNLDETAKHTAYILSESKRRAGDNAKFAISVTNEAAEEWAMEVTMRSAPMAIVLGCTPSYINLEGDLDRVPAEQQMLLARSGLWGWGIENWIEVIEKWRAEGSMKGILIR
ncbi:hypothetical protein N7456_001547 [Penicillium angulare]|uniref:FAD/NAD(P)-binding domain-containing protein n=1 Tax=Penicillium angulare TaxID=116970 RepID=A0A9W9G6W8_9EURO|nr:hypothetical protein N7456_001547 [Penicillium angulare]